MIDKLDLEVPYAMPFRADFARHWKNPANDARFKKNAAGLYAVNADLRDVGIPAMLSIGHKHHKKLGPKLQIIETGEKSFSDWAAVHDAVFRGEAYDDSILRVDLTADVRGAPVASFGRAIWCKFKHTNQQEYGEFQHLTTSHTRFAAQTLYYGRKPKQVRIYDKTLHRQQVLLPKLHREQRQRGEELATFDQAYGYDPSEIVTRVERQMGDRETSQLWSISKFGQLHELVKCDPWERLHFAEDAKISHAPVNGARRMLVEMLRERIEAEGRDRARSWARSCFAKAHAFRKWWQENECLILEVHPFVSREALTKYYRESLIEQLAA